MAGRWDHLRQRPAISPHVLPDYAMSGYGKSFEATILPECGRSTPVADVRRIDEESVRGARKRWFVASGPQNSGAWASVQARDPPPILSVTVPRRT